MKRRFTELKAFIVRRSFALLLVLCGRVRFLQVAAQSGLKRLGVSLLPVKPYSDADTFLQTVLSSGSRSVSFAPNDGSAQPASFESVFPPIMARGFKAAIINCSSSAIIS